MKKIQSKIKRKCIVCNKEFIVHKSTIIYGKAIFCSQDCYHKFRKGKRRPEHSKCLKEWWKEHPEEIEKARQRGLRMVSDELYLQKLSECDA